MSETAPVPDDAAPARRVDFTPRELPGLAPVAGPAGGAPSFLVVAGDDDAGVCVDGVCALPPQPAD